MAKDLRTLIVEKAAADPAFRASLLKDPKAAIRGAFKAAKIPDKMNISVIEQKPDQVYLVLPMGKVNPALSDDALEKVAGGNCVPCLGSPA
jgi:hypothetical protein